MENIELENELGMRKKVKNKRQGLNVGKKGTEEVSLEQIKFFIDTTKDLDERKLIIKLLEDANNKSYGREIILKDLVYFALPKLSAKDLEKIQEGSLSEMQKVEKALAEYNLKNQTNLSLGEFLVKKLGIC
ncbi:MAG TPA: hypothetical protein VNJ08_10595 [Bacteriovoracaceae bacterium]|nr:hypothetical protein [Bacteriovoracaceae bacterium]